MEKAAFKWAIIASAVIGFGACALAQDIDVGKIEYQSSCAACHGADGKGKGVFSAALKATPTDLTVLTKNNNGVFPVNAVYEVIDGRTSISSHGSREMPIWGYRYRPPQAFQLKQDPDIAASVDWKKATRLFFQNQHLDVMKDEEEIKKEEEAKQGQPPPVDPRIAGQLQVAQVRSQGEMEKAKLVQSTDMQELQFKAQSEQTDLQFKAAEAEKDRQLQIQLMSMQREMKIMELSQASNISIEQIKAELSRDAAKIQTQKELSVMAMHAKTSTPTVTTPPDEPVGRADTGKAFQACPTISP